MSTQLPVESVSLALPQFFRWNGNSAAGERANVVRRTTGILPGVFLLAPLGTPVLKPHLLPYTQIIVIVIIIIIIIIEFL